MDRHPDRDVEKEIHEFQTQVRFLEDELAVLRQRQHSTPRQVKVLEERLLESKSQVAKALAQNEKLVSALKTERERIEALKEEVDKLTRPPASFGVFVQENEDGSADVFTSGRKMRVNISPEVDRALLHRGAEVILNEALNVVEVLQQDRQGEVVSVKEILNDGRVIVLGRGDEEMVAIVSKRLQGEHFRAGDALLYDPRSGHVLERLPKEEIEELVLEEVPDVTYEDIGGLAMQIEDIRDAVEMPFLYA
ncbi:MAG TPA: proteasome ATPase, partial [Actinomycetota bacterium]|nr:proteasome ATPase [Actinomycetota bacterium]